MNTRVIAIIPARYASSRFPGKMLASIMGKTVIQRTYECTKLCTMLDDIIVATDHDSIFNHVTQFGGKAVMSSPDCPTGTDRLIEVLQNYPDISSADYILNVQGDEACIDPNTLEAIVGALINSPSSVMASACVPITDLEEILSPSCVKCVMDQTNHALYFSRSPIPGTKPNGSYAPIYHKHLGIYAFKRDFLLQYGSMSQTPLQRAEDLEQLKVLEAGYKIKMITVREASPAVDVPEDIQRVTEWLCNQNLYL